MEPRKVREPSVRRMHGDQDVFVRDAATDISGRGMGHTDTPPPPPNRPIIHQTTTSNIIYALPPRSAFGHRTAPRPRLHWLQTHTRSWRTNPPGRYAMRGLHSYGGCIGPRERKGVALVGLAGVRGDGRPPRPRFGGDVYGVRSSRDVDGARSSRDIGCTDSSDVRSRGGGCRRSWLVRNLIESKKSDRVHCKPRRSIGRERSYERRR